MGEDNVNNKSGTDAPPVVVIPERSANGKNYIMAIGIDEYALRRLSLSTCVNDCEAFTEALTKKYGFTLFDKLLVNGAATKSGIAEHFKKFRELPTTSADSLIIFFSGHGYLFPIKRDPVTNQVTEGIGCWVPQETANLELNSLLKVTDIIDEIRQLSHLSHILIISDCCNSGAILESPTFYSRNGQVPPSVQSLEMAPSRWAICSSRSNELSTAGRSGERSRFTNIMIQLLEKNARERILLNTLVAAIQEAFEQKAWQKPYAAPLDIIENNGGQFVFKATEDLVIIRKREAILKTQLNSLNYKDQRPIFKELDRKGKIQFAIFSGLPSCGLNLLSYRARRGLNKIPQSFPVTHDKFTGVGEVRLVNGLKAAFDLKQPALTLDKVQEALLLRLTTTSIALELRFYDELNSSEGTMPPNHKKVLLDELAAFAETVNSAFTGDFRFYIFVIDYEQCDYETLYASRKIAGIDTTFIPKTKPLQLTELCEWYDQMELNNDDPEDQSKLQEFRSLFNEVIRLRFEKMLSETQGFPGSMLLKICEEAECRELAIKLLDPDKN